MFFTGGVPGARFEGLYVVARVLHTVCLRRERSVCAASGCLSYTILYYTILYNAYPRLRCLEDGNRGPTSHVRGVSALFTVVLGTLVPVQGVDAAMTCVLATLD